MQGTDALQELEKECAEGRTAPRVSLDDIKANIALVAYLTGAEAAAVAAAAGNIETVGAINESLDVLTICLVALKNGFTIIGKSAPASPENFDAELGRKLAYDDAVRQVWPLMGYALREKLAEG